MSKQLIGHISPETAYVAAKQEELAAKGQLADVVSAFRLKAGEGLAA